MPNSGRAGRPLLVLAGLLLAVVVADVVRRAVASGEPRAAPRVAESADTLVAAQPVPPADASRRGGDVALSGTPAAGPASAEDSARHYLVRERIRAEAAGTYLADMIVGGDSM